MSIRFSTTFLLCVNSRFYGCKIEVFSVSCNLNVFVLRRAFCGFCKSTFCLLIADVVFTGATNRGGRVDEVLRTEQPGCAKSAHPLHR